MDELLQKLLEAEVLTEETRDKLQDAFGTMLEEAKNAAKEEAAADVRAELTEQYVKQKEALVEALDTKVGEFLEAELTEMKEDIARFRDLEAEKAEELVEAKAQMADELKGDLSKLIEQIDTFLELRLASEMDELREDLEEVRKNDFGRRAFEGVVEEYIANFADDSTAEATLRETRTRLEDTQVALAESEKKLADMERDSKMAAVLTPLQGRQHDVMEAILANVDTNQLEEAYKTFIGRVVRETQEPTLEKEDKVLAEDDSGKKTGKTKTKEEKLTEAKVITGDTEPLTESDEKVVNTQRDYLRKLAGID